MGRTSARSKIQSASRYEDCTKIGNYRDVSGKYPNYLRRIEETLDVKGRLRYFEAKKQYRFYIFSKKVQIQPASQLKANAKANQWTKVCIHSDQQSQGDFYVRGLRSPLTILRPSSWLLSSFEIMRVKSYPGSPLALGGVEVEVRIKVPRLRFFLADHLIVFRHLDCRIPAGRRLNVGEIFAYTGLTGNFYVRNPPPGDEVPEDYKIWLAHHTHLHFKRWDGSKKDWVDDLECKYTLPDWAREVLGWPRPRRVGYC